jgi:UDP-glucose 4-epimerase
VLGKPARLFPMPAAVLRALAAAAGKSGAYERLAGSLTVDGRLSGWQPPFAMADGLAETAAWYRRDIGGG